MNHKVISLIEALVISYILTGILLCVIALAVYQTKAGVGIANLGITSTYVLASIVSGIIVGRKMETKRYLWGLFVGILYFVILCVVSLCLYSKTGIFSSYRLTSLCLCLAGGMMGGMFS